MKELNKNIIIRIYRRDIPKVKPLVHFHVNSNKFDIISMTELQKNTLLWHRKLSSQIGCFSVSRLNFIGRPIFLALSQIYATLAS